MRKVIVFYTAVVLSGCGNPSGETAHLVLRLKLPTVIAKDTARYEGFLKTVDHLEMQIESESGETFSGSFGPTKWSKLPIPELGFPKDGKDKLNIVVRVWDRTKEGFRRATPILVGDRSVSAKEVKADERTEIDLNLKLQRDLD